MSRFTDNLWDDLAREHGATLAHMERPEPGRSGGAEVLRRPRVLAGGTLGLAGVGVALVLTLGAGGATAPPAFAVTSNRDGSLTINLSNPGQGLIGSNRMLAAKGTGEHIDFTMAHGPAPASGTVDCVPSPKGTSVSGPPVKVTVGPGDSNTQTIASGNTGAGTWHVASCTRANGTETQALRVDTQGLPVVSAGQSNQVVPVTRSRRDRTMKAVPGS